MQTYESEQTYGYGSRPDSEGSHPSFATANDFWSGDESEDVRNPNFTYQHNQMLPTPPPQPDAQPHVTLETDEDDRSTIVAESRRESVDTWEGGRAM